MTLQTMMYNGTSGINSLANNMSVLADNVANLNSVAYKASRVTFQDAITSALGTRGEVGNGARVGAVTKPFQVGQFERSERSTDMAIAGRGFFMLRDPLTSAAELYSRDGQFRLTGASGATDITYNLVSTQGYFVQGYNLNSTATPSTAAEDIVIRRESLPKATESVTVAVNLQSTLPTESPDAPLYSAWDGANASGPLAATDFSFQSTLTAYDDTGTQFDLTIYFDQTANPNEQEFLVTCDPTLDRRLIGATTTRYNDGPVPEKGAGALLYGKLTFGSAGDLAGIDCWDV
ncbi:MAG TPA: flagellar hook-basal body complex protein, partial [Desulfurivibrionaceae bacterium]|nr:flagellar hook-basal body complex protein [Desulfurivibrionaceae bacterium]